MKLILSFFILYFASIIFVDASYDPLWKKKQDCFTNHRKCIKTCVGRNKKKCMDKCSSVTEMCYNHVRSQYCYCKIGKYADQVSIFNQAECACTCSSVDCITYGHGIE